MLISPSVWLYTWVFLLGRPALTFLVLLEKGIVYIGDIDSDDEEKDVDSFESICKGHGISIYNDPCNVRFEVFLPRIDEQSKRVVSTSIYSLKSQAGSSIPQEILVLVSTCKHRSEYLPLCNLLSVRTCLS